MSVPGDLRLVLEGVCFLLLVPHINSLNSLAEALHKKYFSLMTSLTVLNC